MPGRRSGGRGVSFGVGVTLGGGSGIGFGIGAAGAALGLGILGSMGRPSTWSGANSTPLETGPRPVGPDEDQLPRRVKRVRTTPSSTQVVQRSRTPQIPPPRPGFAVPSTKETRFVPGEVLLVIRGPISPQRLKRLETAYGLKPLASARIGLLDVDVRRYALKPGTSVRAAIIALRGSSIVTSAQPNYRYDLQLDPAAAKGPDKPPAAGDVKPAPTQYAISALHVTEAHRTAMGAGIRIAIIDSGIDETNPDLKGTIVERFDALGAPFKAHSHGTAIAGSIVAHHTLVGIAPQAQIIAITAFAGSSVGANGTGFDILRGLDFAAAHGARIVNMSFAGPEDLLLEEALSAARKRGIIAVAAAGNAGPRAKPLYPAAGPGMIAITATDSAGRPFTQANRGPYVAAAAPGVDIIAPGLGDTVQLTSGTSIATAEASGVIALLLQRHPNATPDEILKILAATARRLNVEPAAAGAGLIDAEAAVKALK